MLVLLPEPTSVENAYRFLKAALFRRLQQTAEALGVADLVEAALGSQGSAMRTPRRGGPVGGGDAIPMRRRSWSDRCEISG